MKEWRVKNHNRQIKQEYENEWNSGGTRNIKRQMKKWRK